MGLRQQSRLLESVCAIAQPIAIRFEPGETVITSEKPPFAAYRGDGDYLFASYSHADGPAVFDELVRLHEQDVNIWYDEGIEPSQRWTDELAHAIDKCSVFVAFITPRFVVSENCINEIEYALRHGRPVLVVYLEAAELPRGLELSLGSRQAILRDKYSPEAFSRKLRDTLEAMLQRTAGGDRQRLPPESPRGTSVVQQLISRRIFRAAAMYVAIAWGATEILAFLIDALLGQASATVSSRYLAILFIAGFPVAMYLAWTRNLERQSRRILTASALALALVAALIWLAPAEDAPRGTPAGSPDIRTVAVLPLDNLSGNPDEDYFAAGMTEALIASLSRLGAFRVISRTSVMQYQGTVKTVPEIAGELGANALVEGSVVRAGNKVRITAQLIDAASDHHLWAESFEAEIEDILSLQDEMARNIADRIGANLGVESAPGRKPRRINPRAYDAFLKAQMSYLQGASDPDQAIQAFEQAIELDPTFAPSYAILSDLYGFLAMVSNVSPGDSYLQSRQLARTAIELDPDLAIARVALARVNFQYEWDWAAAEIEFQRALELDPNNAWALALYGAYRVLIHMDCDGGIALLETARDLDPFNPALHFDLGAYAFHCRRYDESIVHLTRTTELAPAFHLPRLMLAWNYKQKGWKDRAAEQCDAVIGEIGAKFDPMVLSSCAWLYGKLGQINVAIELLDRLRNPPAGTRVDPMWLTGPCLALDDRDCALEALENAMRQRSSNMVFLRIAVHWEDLQDDPRYQAILAQMNFPS